MNNSHGLLLLDDVAGLLLDVRSGSDWLLLYDSALPEDSLGLSVDDLLGGLSVDDLLGRLPVDDLRLGLGLDIFRDISDALEAEAAEEYKGDDDEDEADDDDGDDHVGGLGGALGGQRVLHGQFDGGLGS